MGNLKVAYASVRTSAVVLAEELVARIAATAKPDSGYHPGLVGDCKKMHELVGHLYAALDLVPTPKDHE